MSLTQKILTALERLKKIFFDCIAGYDFLRHNIQYAILLLFDDSLLNPLNASVALILETSQLICCAKQLTGFYMRATVTFNELKKTSGK